MKALVLGLIPLFALGGCATGEESLRRGGARAHHDSSTPAVNHLAASSGRTDSGNKLETQSNYHDKYEDVWKAVQMTMATYPIKVNDQDGGIMETDQIKGDSIWKPVGPSNRVSAGLHYSMTVTAKKITEGSAPLVHVTIVKHIQNQADFFAPIETMTSDGSEEAAILYRIHRELYVDRILQNTSR